MWGMPDAQYFVILICDQWRSIKIRYEYVDFSVSQLLKLKQLKQYRCQNWSCNGLPLSALNQSKGYCIQYPRYSWPVMLLRGLWYIGFLCISLALKADQASQFCCRFARDKFKDRRDCLLKCLCCMLQIFQKLFLWWSVTCKTNIIADYNQIRGFETQWASYFSYIRACWSAKKQVNLLRTINSKASDSTLQASSTDAEQSAACWQAIR